MKNLRKTIILATLPMLLVGCIGRQKSVEPEEASRIGRLIFGMATTSTSAYEVPSSYKTIYETVYSKYEINDGKIAGTESSCTIINSYSKEDKVFYTMTETIDWVNGKEQEKVEETWCILEGDKACSYSLTSNGKDTTYQYGESGYISLVDEFGHNIFKTDNYNLLRNLPYFMYSEDISSILGHHSTAKVTYRTYYGSENENSIEVEEDVSIETNDFTNYKGLEDEYSYEKEVHDKKIIVEDFIVSQWDSVDSYESVSKDETIEYHTILEESYNYYDYDSIPTLDKSLWENAKNK